MEKDYSSDFRPGSENFLITRFMRIDGKNGQKYIAKLVEPIN